MPGKHLIRIPEGTSDFLRQATDDVVQRMSGNSVIFPQPLTPRFDGCMASTGDILLATPLDKGAEYYELVGGDTLEFRLVVDTFKTLVEEDRQRSQILNVYEVE